MTTDSGGVDEQAERMRAYRMRFGTFSGKGFSDSVSHRRWPVFGKRGRIALWLGSDRVYK